MGLRDTLLWIVMRTHTHMLHHACGAYAITPWRVSTWFKKRKCSKQWSRNVTVEKAVTSSELQPCNWLSHFTATFFYNTWDCKDYARGEKKKTSSVCWIKEIEIKGKQSFIFTPWLFMKTDDFNGRAISVLAALKAVSRQQPNGGENYIFTFRIRVPLNDPYWVDGLCSCAASV